MRLALSLLLLPLQVVIATQTIRHGRSLLPDGDCQRYGLSELSCAYATSTQVEGKPLVKLGHYATGYTYIFDLTGLYNICVWDWVAGKGSTEAGWKQPIVDFYTSLFPPHTKLNSKVTEMVEQAWQMQGKTAVSTPDHVLATVDAGSLSPTHSQLTFHSLTACSATSGALKLASKLSAPKTASVFILALTCFTPLVLGITARLPAELSLALYEVVQRRNLVRMRFIVNSWSPVHLSRLCDSSLPLKKYSLNSVILTPFCH